MDVLLHPMGEKKIRKAMKDIIGLDCSGHDNRQRLPAMLVNNG
jgi:hypothetical protein